MKLQNAQKKSPDQFRDGPMTLAGIYNSLWRGTPAAQNKKDQTTRPDQTQSHLRHRMMCVGFPPRCVPSEESLPRSHFRNALHGKRDTKRLRFLSKTEPVSAGNGVSLRPLEHRRGF